MRTSARPLNEAPSPALMTRRAFAASCLATSILPTAGNAASTIDIVGALNGFGHDLFMRRLKDTNRNTILSPLSLGLCTAMVASGSAGETAAEFEAALRLRPGACAQLADASNDLSQTLKGFAGLSLANALAFESTEAGFRPDYVARIRNSFDGEVLTTATVEDVNAWVGRKTNGMIPHLVDKISFAVLLDALYFKGEWAYPAFPAAKGTFITGQGESLVVPRMRKSALRGLKLASAQTFLIPYKNSTVTMVIVLPETGQQVTQVTRDLSTDAFRRILESGKDPWMSDYLLMPLFKIDAGMDMKTTFQETGLQTMFDKMAATSLA